MFRELPSFILAGLMTAVTILTGCGSTGSAAGDPADVVGTWNYEVSDAADALNLRRGLIEITLENDLLGGIFSAPHLETRPLLNVRYRNDELTFRIQALPGQTEGVGFALDPDGDTMKGTAFPSSGAATTDVASRQSGSRMSTNLRLRRAG